MTLSAVPLVLSKNVFHLKKLKFELNVKMSWLKYCTIFLLIARVRSQEAIIEINTKQAAYHVSENYVSFSVDAEDIFGNNFR